METLSAAKWCEESLAEWDTLITELHEVRFADKSSSSLLHKALVKRAEEKAAAADVKAEVAALVQQLMRHSDRGSLTIEVPEIQLDVKLTWSERLERL